MNMVKIKEYWVCRILGHKFIGWSVSRTELEVSYNIPYDECRRCGLSKEEIKNL